MSPHARMVSGALFFSLLSPPAGAVAREDSRNVSKDGIFAVRLPRGFRLSSPSASIAGVLDLAGPSGESVHVIGLGKGPKMDQLPAVLARRGRLFSNAAGQRFSDPHDMAISEGVTLNYVTTASPFSAAVAKREWLVGTFEYGGRSYAIGILAGFPVGLARAVLETLSPPAPPAARGRSLPAAPMSGMVDRSPSPFQLVSLVLLGLAIWAGIIAAAFALWKVVRRRWGGVVRLGNGGQVAMPALIAFPAFMLFVYLTFSTTRLSIVKIRSQCALDMALYGEISSYSSITNRIAYINDDFPKRVFTESFGEDVFGQLGGIVPQYRGGWQDSSPPDGGDFVVGKNIVSPDDAVKIMKMYKMTYNLLFEPAVNDQWKIFRANQGVLFDRAYALNGGGGDVIALAVPTLTIQQHFLDHFGIWGTKAVSKKKIHSLFALTEPVYQLTTINELADNPEPLRMAVVSFAPSPSNFFGVSLGPVISHSSALVDSGSVWPGRSLGQPGPLYQVAMRP